VSDFLSAPCSQVEDEPFDQK
jgi:hypothetical protein